MFSFMDMAPDKFLCARFCRKSTISSENKVMEKIYYANVKTFYSSLFEKQLCYHEVEMVLYICPAGY